MARARAKPDRKLSEIAQVIVAEWYRVLSDNPDKILKMDAAALSAAFNAILEDPEPDPKKQKGFQAILDEENSPLKIVVPLPPRKTRDELTTYLQNNGDFFAGMGAAVLFGCGR